MMANRQVPPQNPNIIRIPAPPPLPGIAGRNPPLPRPVGGEFGEGGTGIQFPFFFPIQNLNNIHHALQYMHATRRQFGGLNIGVVQQPYNQHRPIGSRSHQSSSRRLPRVVRRADLSNNPSGNPPGADADNNQAAEDQQQQQQQQQDEAPPALPQPPTLPRLSELARDAALHQVVANDEEPEHDLNAQSDASAHNQNQSADPI